MHTKEDEVTAVGVYKDVILQAVIAFPVIACIITLPYILYNYHKYGSVLSIRILIVYSFILYLICAYFLVILPLPSIEEVEAMTGPGVQLIPFQFVRDIVKESSARLSDPVSWLTLVNNKALFQVVFNVIMTVPFGVYLRYYFRCGLRKTVLFSFLLSLFFELTQLSGLYFIYPRGYRIFDVDDLMANTLGGAAGYFGVKPFLGILPSREEMDMASFRRGRDVSVARRMLAFLIDLPAAGLYTAVLSAVLPFTARGKCGVIWLSYYIFTSLIMKGATVGKKLMKIRVGKTRGIYGQEPRWHQYVIRYCGLWAVLYLVPSLVLMAVTAWTEATGRNLADRLAVQGMFSGIWFFFLLFELVRMMMHRPLFYEKLSGTQIISTIDGGKNEEKE